MDSIKKNLNKIIAGIIILIIITFIYNHFFKNMENEHIGTREVVVREGEIDQISMEILQTLDKLNRIKIDVDFFSENISQGGNLVSFYELIDFSEDDIMPKELGKENIFFLNNFFIKHYDNFEDRILIDR